MSRARGESTRLIGGRRLHRSRRSTGRSRVLVARLDSDGDVLLAGPAVRAVAAHADDLTLLVGPRGVQAAALLPGVDRVLAWRAAWIDPEPEPVDPVDVARFTEDLRRLAIDEAVLLTSYHQSPLPLALLLRLAGVRRIAAVCDDYPGSLLDVRHRVDDDLPESERGVSTAAAAGFTLPQGDDGLLRVREPLPDVSGLLGLRAASRGTAGPGDQRGARGAAAGPDTSAGPGRYVVVHPGASVPSRAWSASRCAAAVEALAAAGHRVVVTGGPAEAALTGAVAGTAGLDLGGRTTFAELAAVLAGADAVVVGNTGPAHLAAAVGTPVVSLFAPVVPAARWAPYGVPLVLLGDQHAACRDSRARLCPVPGHPCLNSVDPADVVAAVHRLAPPAPPLPASTRAVEVSPA